jgi:hypothetical protein
MDCRVKPALTRAETGALHPAHGFQLSLALRICQPRDFLSLITITAPPDCHAKISLGLRLFGVGEEEQAFVAIPRIPCDLARYPRVLLRN